MKATGGRRAPRRPPRPATVIAFIVRRLIVAVLLLLVVSAVTFAIFFLVPRLAGRHAGGPRVPLRRTDRRPGADRGDGGEARLHRPARASSTAASSRASSSAPTTTTGPATEHCPAPCLGYSFLNQNPVLAGPARPAAGDALARRRGGDPVADRRGRPSGCCRRCGAARVFDRAAMGIALAGVSLPIFFTGLLSLSIFSYRLGITAPGGSYTPLQENPLLWAYDLLLPWITLAFLYAAGYARLTRAGMLETMNEDYIRTARAKGLPERTVVVKHGLRSALTPILTIFGLDLGLLLGGAILTESHLLAARHRQVLGRRDRQQRPAEGAGSHPGRRRSSSSSPTSSWTCSTPSSTRGCGTSERGRLRSEAPRRSLPGGRPPTALPRGPRPAGAVPDRRRRGQARSTGSRSTSSAARPWGSSGSPGPARA